MTQDVAGCPDSISVKIVLIGDGAVGKTSLLNRYANDSFNPEHEPTVFENTWVDREIDGRRVELALWDNAGQEEFDKLRLLSYQDTDCYLVVFPINSPAALEHIRLKWIPEIQEHSRGVPLLLVGTKCDLRGIVPDVFDSSVGSDLAKDIQAVGYMECSALKNIGCSEIFEQAVREALASQSARKMTRMKNLIKQKKQDETCCIIA